MNSFELNQNILTQELTIIFSTEHLFRLIVTMLDNENLRKAINTTSLTETNFTKVIVS